MDKSEKNAHNLSRRKFLQTTGTGVVGTTLLAGIVPALGKDLQGDEDPQVAHNGREVLELTINGEPIRLLIAPQTTLAELLRDRLGLTGTKITCNRGQCGACTVLLNGEAVYSCHILALDAAGGQVVTVEGLLSGEKLHPLQQAFAEHDGMQCGFCTTGQIMAAHALLLHNPHPTRDEVLEGMSGNLCRCAAYPKIIESVMAASGSGGES
jgi:xanthine dehydrogenase YagT iron-sulfur-binding subunit